MKSCFFIGHRDAPDSVAEKLTETIEHHISDFSADFFTVGNYGRFDQLVQIALADAKKRHPDIFIRMAVAYSPALGPVELIHLFPGKSAENAGAERNPPFEPDACEGIRFPDRLRLPYVRRFLQAVGIRPTARKARPDADYHAGSVKKSLWKNFFLKSAKNA